MPRPTSLDPDEGEHDLEVAYDDGSLQRRFDDDYGVGVVRVHSAIFPVNDAAG